MSSWEAKDGNTTHYMQLQGDSVLIGSHAGSGHTDNAGVVDAASIQSGSWDAHIKRHFGEAALAQIKTALGSGSRASSPLRDELMAKREPKAQEPEWEDFD